MSKVNPGVDGSGRPLAQARLREYVLCMTLGALMAVQGSRIMLNIEQGREGRAVEFFGLQVEEGIALRSKGIPIDRAALVRHCLAALPENGGIPGDILIARDWLASRLGSESGPGFSDRMRQSCGDIGRGGPAGGGMSI